MKVIITEQQNERLMDMMKKFAEQYADSESRLVKTEVEIRYNKPRDAYILRPTFYVKDKTSFPAHVYRHILSQRVEEYFGVNVLSTNDADVIEVG